MEASFAFAVSPGGAAAATTASPGFNAAFSSPAFASSFSPPGGSGGSASATFGRKSPKEGLDQEKSRRMREEKLNQIRKDRRNDRALMQRRRYVKENEDEAAQVAAGMTPHAESGPTGPADPASLHPCISGTGDQTRLLFQQHQLHRQQQAQQAKVVYQQQLADHLATAPPPPTVSQRKLEELPQKVAWIYSSEFEHQKEALVFFRKLLAQERHPPVELVVSSGIVPRLVEFLGIGCDERLQFEAAWAATNIACAELRFARVMVEANVIPALVNLMAMSESERVREQAIWALSNISGDQETRDLIIAANALTPILWQLGIEKPPHRQLVVQPPLGSMQHIALVLANLSRGGSSGPVPIPTMHTLMNALSELLQSPDDTVYCSVAAALAEICEKGEELIQLVLECGLVSKLHKMLHDPKAREHAVRVFCAVIRSTSDLHVRLVVSSRYEGALAAIMEEITRPDSSAADAGVIYRSNNLRCEICLTLGWRFPAHLLPCPS